MDVSKTDEQRAWEEAVSGVLSSGTCADPAVQPVADDPSLWKALVDIGLPALQAPELSGVHAAGVECMLAVEAAGRAMSVAPVLGQGVLAPALLRAAGADELLAQVADGGRRVTVGLSEDLSEIAEAGRPAVAVDAAGADAALAIDTSAGRRRLVALALDDERTPLIDSLDVSRTVRRIEVHEAGAEPLGSDIAVDAWQRVEAAVLTGLAADLVGVAEGGLDLAVEYAQERRQFGVPIGTFQAVQHLLADAHTRVEGARSCLWYAAWAGDHADPDEAVLAGRVAKAYASAAGRVVVEACVQTFGGIAITWEHPMHLRLRRTMFDQQAYGDEAVQHLAIGEHRLRTTG
jgi:alkylation response protein AidB-like acyl-CoA dehydrogenase